MPHRRPRHARRLAPLAAAAALLLAHAAAGQEQAPTATPSADATDRSLVHPDDRLTLDTAALARRPWTIQVEPMLWWTSPGGKIRLPGTSEGAASSDRVRVERLNLDTPRFSPAAEVHIDAEPWRFSLSAGAFSLSREETTADRSFQLGDVAVSEGDMLDTDFDYVTAELTVGRLMYRHDFAAASKQPEDAVPVLLSLYGLGGLRLYDLDIAVRDITTGVESASQQFYVEPILGVRAELDIDRDYGLDLQISGGYYADSDRSVSSLDIIVGFRWTPTPNIGWQIGWRQILTWMEDGEGASEFEYSGGLAGLYTGVVIRF
jgi:hypothetical protein